LRTPYWPFPTVWQGKFDDFRTPKNGEVIEAKNAYRDS
jgi:hypothetical protein